MSPRCDWCGSVLTPRLIYREDAGAVDLKIATVRCKLTIGDSVKHIMLHPNCADVMRREIEAGRQLREGGAT